MTNKDKYQNSNEARRRMNIILDETLWLEQAYGLVLGRSIDEIRKDYTEARDAAIAFGVDISHLPKKLNWNTNHSRVVN